jgi:predicted component of type VI protein secretion system
MKAYLTVTSGRHRGKTIPITTSPFLIGRDPTAHLRPASSAIGPRHCAIHLGDGKVVIHDLAHGTRLNNQAIDGAAELADGDHLQVGPLAFRISLDRSAGSDKPGASPPEPSEEALVYEESAESTRPGVSPPERSEQLTREEVSEELTEEEVAAMLLKPTLRRPPKPVVTPTVGPLPADGPGRQDWAKRFEARPLHGSVQMPHVYHVTETRPGHVVIHRRAGPRPPADFREVHPNIESAMLHLRHLYLGHHITVTDVPGGH